MRDPKLDFIVVINHEYSKPVKWEGITREEFDKKKKTVNEEGMHLQIVATIKLKTK